MIHIPHILATVDSARADFSLFLLVPPVLAFQLSLLLLLQKNIDIKASGFHKEDRDGTKLKGK